jgi:hypothetical protein
MNSAEKGSQNASVATRVFDFFLWEWLQSSLEFRRKNFARLRIEYAKDLFVASQGREAAPGT